MEHQHTLRPECLTPSLVMRPFFMKRNGCVFKRDNERDAANIFLMTEWQNCFGYNASKLTVFLLFS